MRTTGELQGELICELEALKSRLETHSGADFHHGLKAFAGDLVTFLHLLGEFSIFEGSDERLEFDYSEIWDFGTLLLSRLATYRKEVGKHDLMLADLNDLYDLLVRTVFPREKYKKALEDAIQIYDSDIEESLREVENELRRLLAFRLKPPRS